ncbi:serine/threonine-protein kinase [Tautonia sociabilis]|uniref:Serine/threonine protein kinase n=1 Tax=Tautonia sociabilis TaxID=2080755 RepID=A0A432MJ71_9BACT|nr:serine/threonine-protein kinase [Tautonia sociabilis]RUL87245.1 serine/threonine protein kinase [Tautonia sociabilis]
MSEPGTTEPMDETLSLDRARLVNDVCERFELAWDAEPRPRIEDVLAGAGATGPERRILLRELIALELELRRGQGDRLDEAEYLRRFPRDPEVIDSVFRSIEPESIAGYELLGELGRGGMGVVYRARQGSLNRLVALKVMRAGRLASEAESRRFRIEAEAAAGLKHPNIVRIFEVGCWRGLHYFSMELIEGGSLSRLAPRLRDEPETAAVLLVKVARAVDHAHRAGFVHRDLKPSNILLDGGIGDPPGRREPFVTDFGLVKRVGPGSEDGPTRPEGIVGTLEYMAPEQARGGPIDARTDVYGLGAVLYALLTGRPPFRADSPMETLVLVNEREPEPPRRLNPRVPRDLERVCLRCLEKDPDRRYPSAEAMAEDLDRFLRDEPVLARRLGLVGRLRRWGRREPQLAFRLIAIGAATALTQANYLANSPTIRRGDLHVQVTIAEVLWLIAAVVLQRLARRSGRPERLWPGWVALDVATLTFVVRLLGGEASVLVVGYPVIVVAAGLWSREWLVWVAAGLASLGYAALWAEHVLTVGFERNYYLNIVIASLFVVAAIVSHQVRRLWSLGRYYDHRPVPR